MYQREEQPSECLERLLNEKMQNDFEDFLWNEAICFTGAGLIVLIVIAVFF